MTSLLVATVVISRGNPETLQRTLESLSSQTHPITQVLVVEQSDSNECVELTRSFGFGSISIQDTEEAAGIEAGVQALQGGASWLWILHHDSAPESRALEHLARAAEISPSVAVIGPKQLDWDQPIQIRQLGLTTTKTARPFTLVESEYDQGQYDASGDSMAVSTTGMLVALGLWEKLGGLNPKSPDYAQDIEFCIKARALGYRVIVEPKARVHSKGGLSAGHNSRKRGFGGRAQSLAKAHVHLATILWPTSLLPFLYLAMPLVVALMIPVNLVRKRPARILGQVYAWLYSWFTIADRLAARAQVRSLGPLKTLEKLYATKEQIAHRRAKRFEEEPEPESRTKGLIESGAVWLSLIPLFAGFSLFPQAALQREGLAPLSRNFELLWHSVSLETQSYLAGLSVPSDPFNWFLALLGALWPASPSAALAWYLYLLPTLLFIGLWYFSGLFTQHAYLKNLSSLLGATLLPIALLQKAGGLVELTAVVFGIWSGFFLAKSAFALNLSRAWRWLGLAGLSGAAVAVSSPVLFGFLLVTSIALGLQRLRRIGVLVWFGLPGLGLLWPLINFSINARDLDFLTTTSAAALEPFDPYKDSSWTLVLAVVSVVALIALVARPKSSITLWLLALAMVFASSYQPISSSQALVATALLLLLAITVQALSQGSVRLRALGASLIAIGIGTNLTLGVLTPKSVDFVAERSVPALVLAASDVDSATRTLLITESEFGLEAELVWGDGRQQDEVSLLAGFVERPESIEPELAQLTASLVAGNPDGVSQLLDASGVDFILLGPNVDPGIQVALDSLLLLQASGKTDFGLLWRVAQENVTPSIEIAHFPSRNLQLATLAGFLLLAIPTPASITGRRLRRGE